MPVDNLIFYGTWNDGSSTGSLDFSNVLLSAGDVCEQFFYPATTRGWNSTVPFGLDICSTAGTLWRQLLGNRSNQTYLAGTWKYSHVWDGTAYTLFTGYLPSDAWAEDVLRQTVTINLSGMLGRYAEMTVPEMGGTQGSGDADLYDGAYSPTYVLIHTLLGTGTVMSRTEGTYTLRGIGAPPLCDRFPDSPGPMRIYPDYGTDSPFGLLGSWLNPDTGGEDLLFTMADDPGWLYPGKTFYYTTPWPNDDQRRAFYGRSWRYLKLLLYHWGLGSNANNWTTLKAQLEYYRYNGSARYYGGEKFLDIMHDISAACNLSYSVDADGNFAGVCPVPLLIDYAAPITTLDFGAAYNEDANYSVSQTAAVNDIAVKCDYDAEEQKYQGSFSVSGGTWSGGRTVTLQSPWLGQNDEAAITAWRLIRMDAVPRLEFQLSLEGSRWNDITNGAAYDVINIPATIPHNGSLFRVENKIFRPASDLTTVSLVEESRHSQYVTWGTVVQANYNRYWW
jgi:hypothetical protein